MSEASYIANLKANARGLWSGVRSVSDFENTMRAALNRGFNQAWTEGAKQCAVQPNERTQEEVLKLDELITFNFSFASGLGVWIEKNSRDNGGKLGTIFTRMDMWARRYEEVKSIASQMACGDLKKQWDWDPGKEHCEDCRKYNGRVHRNSVWHRWGIHPRSTVLACGGFRCGCELNPTDLPVTPGRPPNPIGPKRKERGIVYEITCEDCGLSYQEFGVDAVLSDEQWKLIHPEGSEGLLCANCIIKRASFLPHIIAARVTLDILESSDDTEEKKNLTLKEGVIWQNR